MAHARLPGVDRLLREAPLAAAIERYGVELVKQSIRSVLAAARVDAGAGIARDDAFWADAVARDLERWAPGLVPVFNLTGTILHTNLGRAVVGERVARAGLDAATHTVALEYDLATGERGERDDLVEPMLCALTGAEAATVVNNNAAAVLLVLNTLALGREVLVSRSELIEIGGSFRMPDIIERAGARIREVGTTNRTHAADFERAITPATALLLKVHPSNYRIEGFTAAVETGALADIAHAHGLPLAEDLGSGALVDLTRFGLPRERTPREALAHGADLVTFSGDKLLGAVQAGIVVGRREAVDRLRANPLKRALRCDKITLAMLRETLRLYQDPELALREIPLLRALAKPLAEVESAARRVALALSAALGERFDVAAAESRCQIGSGALPDAAVASWAVRIAAPRDADVRALAARLRKLPTPVLGRIHEGALWLDLRAAGDVDRLCDALSALGGGA